MTRVEANNVEKKLESNPCTSINETSKDTLGKFANLKQNIRNFSGTLKRNVPDSCSHGKL